jgi:NADH dehydrogenase
MFGPNDAFLTTILKLLNRLPVYPMFGNGQMRLQPVCVEDVGQAIANIMQCEQTGPTMFECGGPRVYSYEELLRVVARAAGIKSILFPVPFAAWGALAWISESLPNPPITRNQVELMQIDSVSMPELPGLGALGISPHSVEEILQDILRTH